jgi:hypothetical protein
MAKLSRQVVLIAGLALLGLGLGVTPAPAQFLQLFGFPSAEPPPPLPPEVIAGRLARAGYKLSRLRRGPQGYVADAYDPSGRPVRLILDPIDGALLQRSALSPAEAGSSTGGAAPAPQGQTISQPRGSAATRQQGSQKAENAPPRDAGAAAGRSAPDGPPPSAPGPAKPVEPYVPKSGPGYSHGVPINPLD